MAGRRFIEADAGRHHGSNGAHDSSLEGRAFHRFKLIDGRSEGIVMQTTSRGLLILGDWRWHDFGVEGSHREGHPICLRSSRNGKSDRTQPADRDAKRLGVRSRQSTGRLLVRRRRQRRRRTTSRPRKRRRRSVELRRRMRRESEWRRRLGKEDRRQGRRRRGRWRRWLVSQERDSRVDERRRREQWVRDKLAGRRLVLHHHDVRDGDRRRWD